MGLLDVEKFVFYKGMLGCPLREVPDNLIHEICNANTLEIVDAGDNPDASQFLINAGASKTYSISAIDIKGNFVIRPKQEAWKRIVFNGKNIHSGNMTALCNMIIQHPEGLTKQYIKSMIPNSEKNLSKWIKKLEEANVVYTEVISDDIEVLKFNYELIESQGDPKNNVIKPHRKPKTRQTTKKMLVMDEVIEKAVEAIRDYPDGMPIIRLQEFLNASDNIMNAIIRKFRAMDDFQVVEKSGISTKIVFSGIIRTEYIDAEMVKFLLDMCMSLRTMVLSELPKELKDMMVGAGVDDEKLMEILEDNGFKIVEVRCKCIRSDFVIFSPEVDDTDESLLSALARTKDKMARCFRAKMQTTFFKNMYLTSLDNNYSPHLREHIMHLYEYVAEKTKNTTFFLFNNEALLEMNFFAFVRSIPLKAEFHFIEIMTHIGSKLGRFSERITREMVDSLNLDEYERINKECLDIAKGHTLGQVLDMLEDGTECKTNLLGRVKVHEFERILLSTAKHRIFESYFDLDHVYFEKSEDVEKCIDRILMEINDEASNHPVTRIPYPVRRQLFDQISKLPSDEFYPKAMELVESTVDGAYREFFAKRLQSFK